MIQKLSQRLNTKTFFIFFFMLFPISFFLPAYNIPPSFLLTLKENSTKLSDIPSLLFGYECAWGAFFSMFSSPVAFLGTLANFAVLTIWILYLLRISGEMKLFRSILIVVVIVSVLIWPVALRIGLLSGYYLWAISAIGISICYGNIIVYNHDFEEILLDERIKDEEN